MDYNFIYNKDYYESYRGIGYHDKKKWEPYKNEQKMCYNALQDAKKFLEEKERLKTDINIIKNSRAYKVSMLGTKIVNNILTRESARRKAIGKIKKKLKIT